MHMRFSAILNVPSIPSSKRFIEPDKFRCQYQSDVDDGSEYVKAELALRYHSRKAW
jgi:hypothetical protein